MPLNSQIKHTNTTATKIETTEIIVLLTFAFVSVSVSVSVSGINESFSLIRDIFFFVVTSPLRKCWRFAIGRGLNLASGLLLAEAELQSFEFFAMQRMCNSRVA